MWNLVRIFNCILVGRKVFILVLVECLDLGLEGRDRVWKIWYVS